MDAVSACPEPQQWQRLLLGQLPEGEMEALGQHLARCGPCLQTVREVQASDTLVEALRSQSSLEAAALPASVEQIIQRFKGVRPAAGRPPTEETTADPSRAERPCPRDTLSESALPAEEHTPELYDFLAAAQGPGELGRLGPYRVLRVLRAGGMGVVFLAEDPHLERLVALKAMRPALVGSPSAKERFFREAKAAASLKHPHVVTIHQVGEDRGAPFLAMEFLEGEALDERLEREGRLPVSEVLRIGREIAEGLEAAHERGLVHRDIKLGNVWLEGRKGDVKILDFGLARAVGDQTHLTQAGAIVGTPAYMAPEQAGGKQADHRCDLFSLGCVLYRLATGRMPFQGGDTLALLAALAREHPTPPAELLPAVPGPLSDLIMQLLAKDPARRPASARAVADRLQRIEDQLANPPVPPAPMASLPAIDGLVPPVPGGDQPAGRPPVVRRPRSRRLLVIAAALGALALVATAVVFFLETPNGTVRIEINDDNIEAVLTKDGAVVKGANKAHDLRVAAGEQGLKIKRGDLEFETDKFILRRGDTVTLKVELLPDKIQVVQGDKVLGEHALPIHAAGDPDREAAEWVLSIGGMISVNDERHDLKNAADLPRGPFRLTSVDLRDNKQASDAGLAHFEGCKSLKDLNLGGATRVGDVGLTHLRGCTSLMTLNLGGTRLTDTGLACLHGCKNLRALSLSGANVSDAGLAHFEGCQKVAYLWLDGTRVTGAGLAYFKDCRDLTYLGLGSTQIGDAEVDLLAGWTKLQSVDVARTRVTEAGVRKLAPALPRCKIEWDGGAIEPTGKPDPARRTDG